MSEPSGQTLKRTVALVTGAGRREGLGFEVARQLAERGMTVVLTARRRDAAIALAAELAAQGFDVRGEVLEVTSDESLQGVRAVLRELGGLDVLINNAAGIAQFGEQPSSAELGRAREVMETTLFGSWRTAQALLPLLRDREHPRIVNVSSGAGSHADAFFGLTSGNAMGPSYAIAKAALNALTASLAHELRETKVMVNAVCPGFTATFPGGEQMGARPVRDGAASIVWAALLPDDGPRGGLFRDGQPLGW
jgi:NAD(P)-dependent dehydrogenase (short-subunit alcohol dehydrogenase family)